MAIGHNVFTSAFPWTEFGNMDVRKLCAKLSLASDNDNWLSSNLGKDSHKQITKSMDIANFDICVYFRMDS